MRFHILLLASLLLTANQAASQTPTWSGEIAALIYTKCAHCHHEGAIAPFGLMSYQEVVALSHEIEHSITDNKMPPWPANPEYRHFADEFYLTDDEKQQIFDWIAADHPIGELALAPLPPVFAEGGSVLDTIDHQITIPPYTLQTNLDEYRWFAIENPYEDTIYVQKIEVFPGLKEVVHHADLWYDLSGQAMEADAASPVPGFSPFVQPDFYMNAWQPGASAAEYPEGWGIAVPPNADFVVEVHYGPDAIGQVDETVMNLQFVRNTESPRPV